jgi:hypothetical protein
MHPPSRAFSSRGIIATVAVVGLVLLGGVGIVYFSLSAEQPNIQPTQISISPPVPRTFTVLALNVSGHESFSHVAKLKGSYSYSMIFNNTIPPLSPTTVTLNWTGPDGTAQTQTFSVDPGSFHNVTVPMRVDQTISGQFSVSGSYGNEIGFSLVARTCAGNLSFSFTLVNSGGVSGHATVQLLVDGQPLWTNRYFVPQGGQTPGSGNVTLLDCNAHDTNLVVASQEKG